MRILCQVTVLVGIIVLLVSQVAAQDFTIPSNWRKPTSNLTRQERLALVDGLLNTVVRTLNTDNGLFNGLDTFQISESASMLSALSTSDFINGSTTNRDVVLKSLNTMFTNVPNITSSTSLIRENRDPATWGLAAITAHRAYKDPSSLQYAQSMWTQLTAFLITPENAAAGTHPMRNVSIPPTCNFATTAGALFSDSGNSSSINVAGVAVTTYMALSAHLHEETSDPQYLSTAQLSADFIKNHLYNGVIIEDGIDLATCVTSNAPFTYDSGLTIDGLSAITASNSSYAPFLSSLISTVIPYPGWTNSTNGVINEGPSEASAPTNSDFTSTLKAIYIRGLYEAYRRLPSNSSEAGLIRSYVTVQFNALLDLASTPGSNVYSPRWEGPPIPNLNPTGQLTALDVLNSALGFAEDPDAEASAAASSATSVSSPLATATSPNDVLDGKQRGISPGVIGGIVAGVVALLLILAIIPVMVMRRRRRRDRHSDPMADEGIIPQPYPHLKLLESGGSIPTSSSSSYHRSKQAEALSQDNATTSAESFFGTTAQTSEIGADGIVPNPDVGEGGSRREGQVMVNLASFERLVERLDTVMASGIPPSQRAQEEHPPRYEA